MSSKVYRAQAYQNLWVVQAVLFAVVESFEEDGFVGDRAC
jgi:hypothetical protein